MITRQTAYEICLAYDEIKNGRKLVADMQEQLKRGETVDLRDAFGRPRGLQLGVPTSASGTQRLFDVAPELAIAVIKAHVAGKEALLKTLNERAILEATDLADEDMPVGVAV